MEDIVANDGDEFTVEVKMADDAPAGAEINTVMWFKQAIWFQKLGGVVSKRWNRIDRENSDAFYFENNKKKVTMTFASEGQDAVGRFKVQIPVKTDNGYKNVNVEFNTEMREEEF